MGYKIYKVNNKGKGTFNDVPPEDIVEVGSNLSNGDVYDANSYSTDEIKTGGTWIDGKPIYRKVVIQENYNGISIGGQLAGYADEIIDLRGSVLYDNRKYLLLANGYDNSGNLDGFSTQIFIGNDSLDFWNVSFSKIVNGVYSPLTLPITKITIIVEYTKQD